MPQCAWEPGSQSPGNVRHESLANLSLLLPGGQAVQGYSQLMGKCPVTGSGLLKVSKALKSHHKSLVMDVSSFEAQCQGVGGC